MSHCQCRCHASSGTHVSCDTGRPQPGGSLSCVYDHTVEDIPLDQRCVLGHPEPTERFIGYTCRRHYHWIDRTLLQIEELFALTDDVRVPQLSNGLNGERGGTRDGSPAPGRIEVMAITDSRAKTPIDLDGEDDIPDLPGSLASWARIVVEERPTTDQLDGTVTGSIRVLRRERHWVVQQEWIDDYVTEIAALHRAVARGIGDTMWPRPIGKCPNDQTPLYNTIGIDEVTCRKCKATWRGVHLARLRLIHEQDQARKIEEQAQREATA